MSVRTFRPTDSPITAEAMVALGEVIEDYMLDRTSTVLGLDPDRAGELGAVVSIALDRESQRWTWTGELLGMRFEVSPEVNLAAYRLARHEWGQTTLRAAWAFAQTFADALLMRRAARCLRPAEACAAPACSTHGALVN